MMSLLEKVIGIDTKTYDAYREFSAFLNDKILFDSTGQSKRMDELKEFSNKYCYKKNPNDITKIIQKIKNREGDTCIIIDSLSNLGRKEN